MLPLTPVLSHLEILPLVSSKPINRYLIIRQLFSRLRRGSSPPVAVAAAGAVAAAVGIGEGIDFCAYWL